MGKYRKFFMASIIGLTFQKLHSQNQFATLEKNHNIRAKDLIHELNATKDTLLLNSLKSIDYVYAINSDYKREIDFYNNSNMLKVPLASLSIGKHVFVVGHDKMQIVFVIRVWKEETDEMLASLPKNQLTTVGD